MTDANDIFVRPSQDPTRLKVKTDAHASTGVHTPAYKMVIGASAEDDGYVHAGNGMPIVAAQGGADAFGRFRMSTPTSIWQSKNLYDRKTQNWSEVVTGSAQVSTLSDEAAVGLYVYNSGDSAIRQTKRYFSYLPGRSHNIMMTGVFASAQTNLTQRIGYFDPSNGLFFELDGTTLSVGVRTDTSGSAVDTTIAQADWNVDKLDGTGHSGITLDITQAQIFYIDFQWLGVGLIRFGFDIGGKVYICHQIENANASQKVYMATPTLPLRYEITANASVNTTHLKEICTMVDSEAGRQTPGDSYSVSNGPALITGISARKAIMALRLKPTFNGHANRRTAFLRGVKTILSTNNAFFEIVHVHGAYNIALATTVWTSTVASGDSSAEYTTKVSALVSAVGEHVIDSFYGVTNAANKADIAQTLNDFISEHNFICQNYDSTQSQMFMVYVTPLTGTCDAACTIDWVEFE